MKDCIGIIISTRETQGRSVGFGPLAEKRPDYMIPFAGRYRIVDFALSAMSNYQLSRVMLYGGNNIRSTLDHIGDGKSWELNRRNNGLFINPPSYEPQHDPSIIRTYYDSITFFEESSAQNILIMNPMTLSKVDLNEAYAEFKNSDADVMLFYKNISDREGYYTNMRKLILDENGNFLNIGVNLGTNEVFPLYMDYLFIKKDLFIELVTKSLEQGDAATLIRAINNYKNRINIKAYEVKTPVIVINNINSYYRANMQLLNPEVYDDLFFNGGMVYTKSKDEPSTIYADHAHVQNSLVANGCIIEGQVENSILFRGVHVQKNAIVRNSILNEKTVVEENAVVVNTITDKNATIARGVTVAGAYAHPFVVGKNVTIER
ncbi:MAG: glucose-1-phosphate adenylyltransferase subunit GlgD [Peptoniphilaceae bacterium]|nr:glucose-1-phosphate adenylyltransferase subunit GlgD [Peptoniphilaceae bacterium]MDY6085961.1 glucose-1-phosphate adenylyltransferase subunit GlgD [Peptoniphilaceae bacterium]